MCTISNKLKLCACKTKDVYTLKNFWVLSRFVKGKKEIVLGETMMPSFNPLIDDELNEQTLLTLLNDGDLFDVTIALKNKDLLHLAFTFKGGDEQHHDYGFKYNNGKWKTAPYDPFSWYWHHDEMMKGKIKNAIDK